MRVVAIIFTILVGTFFILARDFSARFMLSFDYHRPAVRKREKTFLRWYAVASVGFGVVCIVLGVLMAMNIAFPS